MATVGIVGTTSWGTTLGITLARRGIPVFLWARTQSDADKLNQDRQNPRFVPGVEFPTDLNPTASPQEAFGEADLIIIAVPSGTMRDNMRAVSKDFNSDAVIVSATKGLELETGKRMSQLLQEELPPTLHSSICVLSGPNLAREIVQGKPSSTVIASSNTEASRKAQDIMNSNLFRVYTNEDIVGVEFGGSLKNIIALGAGICDGLNYGDNAKAAFITRGLAEISRLAVAAGANPLTLSGLAGLGDLVATCSSTLSRNHYFGEQLAKGKTPEEIQASMHNVAEGVNTTSAAITLAEKLGVEMPIAEAMNRVLSQGVPLNQAIAELLERAPRPE